MDALAAQAAARAKKDRRNERDRDGTCRPKGGQWHPSKGAPPPPPAGRPGAGGAFAAALPGALVPELLWAHYMPALSVDCEQK